MRFDAPQLFLRRVYFCAHGAQEDCMAQILVSHLAFTYPGSFEPLFEDVSFTLDSSWKLGFVGRNGRGKTTFLLFVWR